MFAADVTYTMYTTHTISGEVVSTPYTFKFEDMVQIQQTFPSTTFPYVLHDLDWKSNQANTLKDVEYIDDYFVDTKRIIMSGGTSVETINISNWPASAITCVTNDSTIETLGDTVFTHEIFTNEPWNGWNSQEVKFNNSQATPGCNDYTFSFNIGGELAPFVTIVRN